MTFVGRGPDPVRVDRQAATLGSHFDEEQRVWPLGHVDIGGNKSRIRFRASRACQFVRVHVQHSGQARDSVTRGLFTRGLGRHETKGLAARGIGIGPGGITYNPDGASTESQVDCRASRQQQVTVDRDGTNQYVVYLVPEFLEVDGTFSKFDGVDADDHTAVMDLGV